MTHSWNDDERDTSGMVSSRSSMSDAKEQHVSICDAVRDFYRDQKERQYARVLPERRRPMVFAPPPPRPVRAAHSVLQAVDGFVHEEEDDNDVGETNETILENEMYKKSWYS